MLEVSIIGRTAVAARLKKLSPAIRTSARKRLGIVGEHLATWYRDHFEESGLHVRTGDMRRSGAAMPVEEDEHMIRGGLLVGQGLPYPPVQEFGATIVPKHAQYLTIPLDAVLTAAGVPRFSAGDAEAAGYRTFVRGRILYGAKDGVVEPLFYLADEVKIPPRPTVKPTLDDNREYINRQLKEAVDDGIRGSE